MPTVASTADKVQARLILPETDTAGDPGTTIVEAMVRDAYREVFGQVSLPRLVEATVTQGADGESYEAEVAGIRCHVLGHKQRVLIPGLEYYWTDDTVHFSPGVVITGDEVWAWVTPAMDFSAATITTDCVHGPEWLEPAAIWKTEMLALSRMARPASSTGAANHGAHYRSLEAGDQALIKSMQQQHDNWLRDQLAAAQARIQMGDAPLFQSRYATIRNRSSKGNRAIGTR
jgi:hypothetical protein